jgi:hypothetical protein
MSDATTTTASTARRANGWRTTTLVLLLLCIGMGVAWFMRERQVRLDHDQERENFEIQMKMLQRELDSRPPAPEEADDQPSTPATPTTRPAAPQPS